MPEKRVYLGYVNRDVSHIFGLSFWQVAKLMPSIALTSLSLMLFVLFPDALVMALIFMSAGLFWALFNWNNRTLDQNIGDIWRFIRMSKRYVWSTGVLPKGLSVLQRLLHFEEVYKDSFRREFRNWDRIIVLTSMVNFSQSLEELQDEWTRGFEELLNGIDFRVRFVNRTTGVSLAPYRSKVAATIRRQSHQLRAYYAETFLSWLDTVTASEQLNDTEVYIVLTAHEPMVPGKLMRWLAKKLARYEFSSVNPRESAIGELERQTKYFLDPQLGKLHKAGWQGRLILGEELPTVHKAMWSTKRGASIDPWAHMPKPIAISERLRPGSSRALPQGNVGSSLVKVG